MGYILSSAQTVSLIVINILQVLSITTRLDQNPPPRTFRRHIEGVPFPDWELGLREAVYQALLRERNLQPNLREFLYNAPLLGRQNSATPFGDIAILARGQLYSAPGGFQFVQDRYQNDCDGCHNVQPPGCDRVPCENWKPEAHERLLALWSVKRIRHRDPNFGYRFELEYKVSPMSLVDREPFVTRNGNFDYGLPGHTFIVKSDPHHLEPSLRNLNSYPSEKYHRSADPFDPGQWSPNFGPQYDSRYLPPPPTQPTEDYYEGDYRNGKRRGPDELSNKYLPPKLEGINQYLPPRLEDPHGPPHVSHEEEEEPSIFGDVKDDDEHDLYKMLLETLARKTSTTSEPPRSTTSKLTTSLLSSQTTSPLQATLSQMPLLPTVPLRTSAEDAGMTRPLFTPTTTIKFPTAAAGTERTTSKAKFSESTPFVKYSEPDPLYANTIASTRPTYPVRTTTKTYRTTRKYKTTESDDSFDIFGPITQSQTMQSDLPPPDQAITVVSPPNMVTEKSAMLGEKAGFATTEAESSRRFSQREFMVETTSPTFVEDLNDTHGLLQPNGASPGPSTSTHSSSTTEITTEKASTKATTTAAPEAVRFTTLSTEYFTTKPNTRYTDSIRAVQTTETTRTASIPTRVVPVSIRTLPIPVRTQPTPVRTPPTPVRTLPTLVRTQPTHVRTLPTPVKTTQTTIRTSTNPATILPPTAAKSTTEFSTPRPTLPITKATRLTPTTIKTISLSRRTLPSILTRTTTPSSTVPFTTTSSVKTTLISSPITTTTMLLTVTEDMSAESTTNSALESSESTTTQMTTTDFIATSPSTSFSISRAIPTKFSIRPIRTRPTLSIFKKSTTVTTPKATESTSPIVQTTTVPPTSIKVTEESSTLPRTTMTTESPTEPTEMILETTATSTILTPKTTSTISVTKPTVSESEATKSTPKTSSTPLTTTDDFLKEDSDSNESVQQHRKVTESLDDSDIFGQPQKNVSKPTVETTQGPKNSKEIDEIFGDEARKVEEPESNESQTPKIIFSGFYSPSTLPASMDETTIRMMTNQSIQDSFVGNKTESEPLTSQSYSTSISVEVNNKSKNTTGKDYSKNAEFGTIKAEVQELPEINNYKVYKAEFPELVRPSVQNKSRVADIDDDNDGEDIDNDKIFDALALSLVNHVRSIDYLHSNNNNNCTTAHNDDDKTVVKRKYKRRGVYRVRKIRRQNGKVEK